MKKSITRIMAALALLVTHAIPMGVWGQSTYTKVTTAPSNWSGTYVIVADDSNVIFTGQSGTNNYGGYATVTISNNSVTGNFTAYEVEIEQSGTYYSIKHISSSKYLGWTSGNSLAFSTTAPTANSYRWNLSTSSILNADDNSRKLQYNSGSPRFACYTSNQKVAYLYKKEVSSNTPTITADPVSIGYNQTSGSITYTIDPATDATITDVQVTESNPEEWLTVGTNYTSPIALTCQTNTTPSPKTAIVTLTCTFGNNQTTTKTVSVTQTGNPDVSGGQNDPYSVAEARAAIDANVGVNGVYATGFVSRVISYNNNYHSITYWISDDGTENNELEAYGGISGIEGWTFSSTEDIEPGATVVIYGNLKKYNDTYEFDLNNQLVSYTAPSTTEPSITVTPATLTVDAQEHLVNYLDLAYENIEVESASSFTVHYYNAEGEEIQVVPGEAWMIAGVVKPNDVYQVLCVIIANEGEIRTAYFKLSALDAENNTVYSNLVTVNQEAYVAPSFAELPFAFNSGRAAIEETDGLYEEGLGSDYNAETNPTTKLKFDGTGDWLLLQFDERPGTLSFDIKGNSFSGGTFTVQTSEDGETYVDLAEYTELGDVATKTFDNLGENVRYIKWIYTTKVSGNVGLGNIALAKYVEPVIVPSITITPDNFELDANSHLAEVLTTITYQNIVVVSGSGTESFDVQYYDAEGQEIEETWCSVGAAAEGDTDFNLIIVAGVNEGNEARTAYFKLYGLDEDANLVYSNLVTVTQAAPVIDYAVLPFVWEGGSSADFLALNGVTANGLGGDYASGNAPYLIKFDGTGDYIQVKCDQQPGKVTIGVKMIGGGNTSTITIQGSADGETFTDIEELEISGAQNDELTLETTTVFAENDRYVRMLFTKGSNVGVGPITIAKGSAPSIAVTPATLDLEATGTGQNGVQMQQFVVTYHNMDIEDNSDFAIQFYDAEGEEQEQPTWITPNPAFVAGGNEEGYMVMLFIEGNIDVARSAYFKVYALGEEDYIYSNLVTINQAGAPQQYTLTVEPFENLDLITFVNDEMVLEGDGEITVTEGDEIMLSVVALEGYEMETLMVNGVNHVNDIDDDFTYSFEMPAENVTISATVVEDVAPAPSNYVRITALDQLTDGSKVIIAARHNATVDSYYAMKNATSNKPEGTMFTSMTSGDDEVVASTITDDEDNYYWTVNVTENGYTFTNAAGALIGYSSGTNFYTGGDNTEWTIERSTAGDGTMVPGYAGFVIKNSNTNTRAFAFNGTAFGAYATTNMNAGGYNFFLDFFVETEPVTVTYPLDIIGYEAGSDGGYYLIASPVTVNPANVEGMTAGEYDLYSFDQAEAEEWRNYKVNAFNLEPGKGYLYAKQATEPDEVFHFELTGTPYNNQPITLSKSENVDFSGWNLVGNPYGEIAYIDRDFYVMKSDGSEIIPGEGNEIAPMQGFFVIAATDGEELTFSNEAPTTTDGKIVMNVSNARRSVVDRAMVRFGEGRTLPKFMLNDENTKIYIAEGNEEYAVVRSINENLTPVSFHAAENGTYTLNVNTENVDFSFFHLIDNMTGNDIDLLSTPSYTFEASTTDYAQRFSLLYATLDGVDENNAEAFAFFNGNEWVVNNEGEANLQVIDMTGRLISSETVNGTATINLNQSAGIYMLRLVNGNNVKVQKVVVR